MKITIYELLGLIKDGKAPKKIKDNATGHIYEYDAEWLDYKNENTDYFIMNITRIKGWLEIKVEILNEEDEFIDIEELDLEQYYSIEDSSLKYDVIATINDIIKNQKLIINKLKEEGK